jgi:hypothetical protein
MNEIAQRFEAHPRMAGHYVLRLVDISALRPLLSEDRMLDAIFEQFDGRTWPAYEQRVAIGPWRAHATSADDARAEVVGALVGGVEIGHSRDTMSAAAAGEVWTAFSSLFATERTYFVRLGLGDPRYAYQRGAAIVDATRAGYVGVVEDD